MSAWGDGVNDLHASANEKYISLFCTPNDAYECPKVLLIEC